MRFTKGNVLGRKKGTQDMSWCRVSTWINELKKVWPELTANQKAHYSTELTKLLISKLKSLPTDPSESVTNVTESLEFLTKLEQSDKTTRKQE